MNTKLAWGKGGGEYFTAVSLSDLLQVPIIPDGNFQTVSKHHGELLSLNAKIQIAALEQESRAAAQNIIMMIDPTQVRKLSFNADHAGALGNRSDIALLDADDQVVAGVSSKHNSKEKGSFRPHWRNKISPLTGEPYSQYSTGQISKIWNQIHDKPSMYCRDRKSELVGLFEDYIDVEMGEIYWAMNRDFDGLCRHFTKLAFGCDSTMVEVSYRKTAKGYTHTLKNDFANIVDIGLPTVRAAGDHVLSRSAWFPVMTDRGDEFGLSVRYKNGNSRTHYKTGAPQPFIKTSITRESL